MLKNLEEANLVIREAYTEILLCGQYFHTVVDMI